MPDVVMVRAMRNLRLRHNIPLPEIAEELGVRPQWISKVELGKASVSIHTKHQIILAFRQIIEKRVRDAVLLEAEINEMKDRILEEEPEWISP